MLTRAALVRRPAVLAAGSVAALAVLFGAGSLVARAVEGDPTPTATTSAGATETTAADAEEPADAGTSSGGSTSQGDDNVAAAVNTKDGSTVYAVRLRVVRTDADVVDAGNAAVAVASCDDCTTVAIALEGVLVTGDAEQVVPVNLALAYNQDCSGCQTLAYAYQKVMGTGGKVRITGEGSRAIAALRAELNRLRAADLPLAEVKDTVDRIAREFATVLETQTVPVGRDTDGGSAEAAAAATPTPGPSDPSQAPDGTSEGQAEESPDATVSPAADSAADGG